MNEVKQVLKERSLAVSPFPNFPTHVRGCMVATVCAVWLGTVRACVAAAMESSMFSVVFLLSVFLLGFSSSSFHCSIL